MGMAGGGIRGTTILKTAALDIIQSIINKIRCESINLSIKKQDTLPNFCLRLNVSS